MVEGFSLLAFLEADRRVAHGDVRPTGGSSHVWLSLVRFPVVRALKCRSPIVVRQKRLQYCVEYQ
jgi:hypothetical protein